MQIITIQLMGILFSCRRQRIKPIPKSAGRFPEKIELEFMYFSKIATVKQKINRDFTLS